MYNAGSLFAIQNLSIRMLREEVKKLNSVYPHEMPILEVVPCAFFNDSNLMDALYVHLKAKKNIS